VKSAKYFVGSFIDVNLNFDNRDYKNLCLRSEVEMRFKDYYGLMNNTKWEEIRLARMDLLIIYNDIL
jgi:hypothetical protein